MKRILFVCTGNTCRSPMAEAILKNKNLPDMEVKSAGIYAANGMEASHHAQKVMDDHGLMHNHRSSLLSNEVVEWADFIFTMTSSHKFAIQQQYPHAIPKVFTLKEYTGETFQHDVVDPFGGNSGIYQQTFDELDQLITKALEKLKNDES